MLAAVRAEALTRFGATRAFVQALDAREVAVGPGDPAVRAGKGLVFVQNYAVYEYVVVQAVRAMVVEVNRLALPLNAVRLELLSLALHPEFDAVTGGALKKTWENRVALLRRTRTIDALKIHDGLFPKDGSHFRPKQLATIRDLFGVPGPTLPAGRLIGIVDEMVENRNKIAHGEDAAEDVGRRYTLAELTQRVEDTEAVCSHLLSAIVGYVASAAAFR